MASTSSLISNEKLIDQSLDLVTTVWDFATPTEKEKLGTAMHNDNVTRVHRLCISILRKKLGYYKFGRYLDKFA